jgi:tetratricopeptide (TPR) repeat protein
MRSVPSINQRAILQQAVLQHQSGGLDKAIKVYRRLLQRTPSDTHLLYLLGTAEAQRGNLEQGIFWLGRSLELAPATPLVLINRAFALQCLGRYDEALADCDRAIELDPGYAHAYCNRGNIFLDLRRFAEALTSSDRAIALDPNLAEAHCNRGNALQKLERWDEALAAYDRAVAIDPALANAYSNRSSALISSNRPEEALADCDRAIELDPGNADAHVNRSVAHKSLRQWDEAIADCDRAIALKPDYPSANWNKALLKLQCGDFAAGWRLYEWRWKRPPLDAHARDFSQPLWLGDAPLAGKTLLLHAEQGLGDTIQFCRYLPLAAAMAGKIVVEAPETLLPLLATLTGAADYHFVKTGDALPQFDLHCPLMSLPLAFATRRESIPAQVPYLFANPQTRAQWRSKLGERRRPRIGLAWSGKAEHVNDRNRSLALAQLAPLLQLPFDFHAVHNEIRPADAAALSGFPQLATHTDELVDFSDTAALIAELDLTIAVDTSVAHLAGALGRPLWLLLPWVADWRWLDGRDDSPWYPGAKLFRQPEPQDWSGVIAAVTRQLAAAKA